MTTEPRNPDSIEGFDTAWFAGALADRYGKVLEAKTIDVIHGTATKVQVHLKLQGADGQVAERNVWVKTGLEAHSQSIGQDAVYAGEVYYYTKVAGRFTNHTPECLYAKFEPDTARSVVVMADLLAIGAKFTDPIYDLSPELTAQALKSIARYQAESWETPFLKNDAYLSGGGVLNSGPIEGWMFADENWALQSSRPRFKAVPKVMLDRDLWRKAHKTVLNTWWKSGPACLSHGDAHTGQSYTVPNGEVRLLDWQCIMAATWGHDFAYFLTTALSPADRRQCEGDLLKAHMTQLQEQGVKTPSLDDAWTIYRACAFYGSGWALCKTEMQSEENCTAIAARTLAAVEELKSLEVLEQAPPAAVMA